MSEIPITAKFMLMSYMLHRNGCFQGKIKNRFSKTQNYLPFFWLQNRLYYLEFELTKHLDFAYTV